MLLILCLAALGGLLAGELWRLDTVALGGAASVCAVAAVCVRQRTTLRTLALVACVAAVGGLRAELHKPLDSDPLAHFEGLTVTLRGRVDSVPQRTERAVRFGVAVDQVVGLPIDQPSARVLVIADPTAPVLAMSAADLGPNLLPAARDDRIPPTSEPFATVRPHTSSASVQPPGAVAADREAAGPGPPATDAPEGGSSAPQVESGPALPAAAAPEPPAAPEPTTAEPDHGHARAIDPNPHDTTSVPFETQVLDTALHAVDLAPDDTVEVHGKLGLPDRGSPSLTSQRTLIYPDIRLVERDTSSPRAVAARVRSAAIAQIERRLPEPQASLAAGVLLGGSGNLDASFKQHLERSGLAHIVAIDGYKQILVTAALAALALRFVGRPWAAAPVLLGLLGYTLLTGARPSAVRAGIMVGLASLAYVVGYLPDALTSLLLAATLMVGFDPEVLLDTGFQLSCSATLGLILLWPRIQRALRGIPRPIAEPAGLTFAVTLATLPVTLTQFGSVSLVSPLAHVVGMPLLAPVLLGAAVVAACAPLPLFVQEAVGALVNLPVSLLVETVRLFGSLPSAALSTGRPSVGFAIALGAALLAWGLWHQPDVVDLRRRLSRTLPIDASGRLPTSTTPPYPAVPNGAQSRFAAPNTAQSQPATPSDVRPLNALPNVVASGSAQANDVPSSRVRLDAVHSCLGTPSTAGGPTPQSNIVQRPAQPTVARASAAESNVVRARFVQPRPTQPSTVLSSPVVPGTVQSNLAQLNLVHPAALQDRQAWPGWPHDGWLWRTWLRPAVVALGCTLGLLTCLWVRPDGRVHVQVLEVSPGQALLIRGPTGRTALVGRGRLDARALTSEVATRLAVWEHGLDAAVDLDADAAARFEPTLQHYPAQVQLHADQDARVDLGGGAVLDLYARSPGEPAVALSFARSWVRLLGEPPRPAASTPARDPAQDSPAQGGSAHDSQAPDGAAPALMLDAEHGDLVLDASGTPERENVSSGPTAQSPVASGQTRPLLQPDQQDEIEHDHQKHDDQLHPFADDHRLSAPSISRNQ